MNSSDSSEQPAETGVVDLLRPKSPEDEAYVAQVLKECPSHWGAEYSDRYALLANRIRPIAQAKYTVNSSTNRIFDYLRNLGKDYGGLDLNPDYQRGHVWSESQQQAYVLNLLRSALPESALTVQLNCPNWDNHQYSGDLPCGLQCVDGLQRLTALRRFFDGQFLVCGLSPQDLAGSPFDLGKTRYQFVIQVFAFQSKKDLLAHYLAINNGGTPHSAEEIQRVQLMLANV